MSERKQALPKPAGVELGAYPAGAGRRRGFGGADGQVAKPKQLWGTLRRLWRYLRPEEGVLLVVFLLVLADAALTVLGPYLIGRTTDVIAALAANPDLAPLRRLLLLFAAVFVFGSLLGAVQAWLTVAVSQRVVRRLRTALFDKLQRLPLAYFDTHAQGDLMSRLTNDIDNVSSSVTQSSAQLMSGFIAILGSLSMMLLLSPRLTLAALVTAPLMYGLTRLVTGRTQVLFKEQQARLGRLNAQVEESISGVLVVKAFNREASMVEEFSQLNRALCQVGTQAQLWSGLLMPFMNVINNVGFAAVALAGGVLAIQEGVTVGVIASFLGYTRQFVRPLNELANIFNVLQSGVAGAERVFEVLDEAEERADEPQAASLTAPRGDVVFEHVAFGYRPDVPIINDVSLVVPAGSRVAIVGPTGAGKTTLVNLLARFYDVTDGRILLDGRDIRTYTRDSLRQCFGIVLQDTYLFAGTIKENIRYGRPAATDEDVKAAAVKANADFFIRHLPHQYDTVLLESAANLSQGQRQLLAIARAILADPAILILDEATSSIDTRTELCIQDALLRIMQQRTTFIIAHRLNTIRDADVIVVLDGGAIVEQGSHDELIARRGRYYELFFNQFQNIQAQT